ncbi:ABC transporter ATP-binding protein [Romboutsia sp.]|uniref:ABC transporter ATP-binding protein n=1 Tax=Romboutsia sp. TaxID=1965302 RepID=UPI003F41719F
MSNQRKVKMKGPGGGGPMGNMLNDAKAKDFKGTMKKLLNHLKPFKIAMLVVLIFAIGSSIFSIAGPKILGNATTEIFEGLVEKVAGTSGGGIDFTYIGKILTTLAILYAISAVFSFIQGFITSDISQKVSYQLRKEISEKINLMPLKYFDKMSHGEVLSRVTNDVDAISNNLQQILAQMITAITTIIGVLIMMLSISLTMTIGTLVVIPLSMVFMMVIVKKSQVFFRKQQEYLGHTNGHIEEIYSGHTIVKAFNREEKAIEEFDELNETLYNTAWKSQFLSGLMMPVMTFIGNLGYVVVAILGGYLAIQKAITVGDIQAFIQYSRNFMQPIAQTAQIANIMQATAAAAERVFEFLEEEEEIVEVENPVDTSDLQGKVSFKDVNFGYNEDKTIINNFSIDIKQGQKVAIVGPTGAGKTTIVKLLMRFYDVNSGQILIDDHNIQDFSRGDLRRTFGMVLQDTWLFSGSIMENIRYGRLDATDEEVIQAAKLAHAHHFIKTLPGGYNMVINEEANNISQGQKQLLTIARAILANPKILILDEATSSVDTRTEVLIQKAMENLMEGRTSFIIAHRLSTIRDANTILVMNDGDIVEQGNHKALLASNGFYANLYNSQFENKEVV